MGQLKNQGIQTTGDAVHSHQSSKAEAPKDIDNDLDEVKEAIETKLVEQKLHE